MLQHAEPRRRVTAIALIAAVLLALIAPIVGARSAGAGSPNDAVLDWNVNAMTTLIAMPGAATPGLGQTAPVSAVHMAIVQGAVYDAVNMIDGGYEAYLDDLPDADSSASKAAAVATAAHDVLVDIAESVPLTTVLTQAIVDVIVLRLHTQRDVSIAAAITQDGAEAVAEGRAAGAAAAAAMLDDRSGDGRYGSFLFTPGTKAGQWRPTSNPPVNDPFAWVAKVDPFVMKKRSQFRSDGPYDLDSRAYARDYNEVKALGAAVDSTRTPEQTAIADFYTNNVSPIELFNRTFRTIAVDEGLTLVEQARLFGMLNLAGADALIACWDDKAKWSFWRPVTAVHEGDNDRNRRTAGDTTWAPYGGTPPYPDHSSGYNCATGAFMNTAKAFFGKNRFEFSVVRIVAGVPNVTRNYSRFTDVVKDTIEARILQGIHFRKADVDGAEIGKDVARWLDKHYFEPED